MEKDTSLLKKDAFAAMRLKDFRLYAGMRMCFTFAAQLQTTVIGFYIYQLTHSTVAIAFIGLSEIVPALGLALYGGYIADKYEKRKMLLLVCAGLIFTSAVIFIVTLHGLAGYFPVSRLLPVIYSMLFLNGIARAFYEPAMFAVFAQSAAGEFSSNASGWNTLSWQTAGIIGPMAGGLIYALAGRDGISMTYAVLIGLLVISLALAFRLKKYPAVHPKRGHPQKRICRTPMGAWSPADALCHEPRPFLCTIRRGDGVVAGFRHRHFDRRCGGPGYDADGTGVGRRPDSIDAGEAIPDGKALAQPVDSGGWLWLLYHRIRAIP